MAFYPSMQASPMWLLAVAFAGSDGKVSVFDISDLVGRISQACKSGSVRVRIAALPLYMLMPWHL